MLSEQKMKNMIREKSKETGIEPQQLYGLFAMEQVLIKLNHSPFKNHKEIIILKLKNFLI